MRAREKTPITVLILDHSGSRVNLIPPFTHLELRDLNDSYLSRARVLHSHLFNFDICLHCARLARKSGAVFSLDLELHRARGFPASKLDELLALTQVLFCTEQTLAHFAPKTGVRRAAQLFRARGPKVLVITRGTKGSLAVNEHGEVFQARAPKVKAVDETGAGDCFAGAFFYGYLKGWPLPKIMHYACAASAGVVTQIGARAGQPALEEFLSRGRTSSIEEA